MTQALPVIGKEPEWTAEGLFDRAYQGTAINPSTATRLQGLFRNAAIADFVPGLHQGPYGGETRKVFSDPRASALGKMAYVAGRLTNDVISEGIRAPYWFLNHPLAITSLLSGMGSTAAGLAPDRIAMAKELIGKGLPHGRQAIDVEFARRAGLADPGRPGTGGLPMGLAKGVIPLVAATALIQASGNHDFGNLSEGGRTPGYESILMKGPGHGRTETRNAPLELFLRYVVGRSGRLLPWEEFHAERPDVTFADYKAAVRHQFDKGPLGIGLIKGTGRNLEGEPEATMMGFRVPLSAAATGAGAIGGGVMGAKLADKLIGEAVNARRAQQPPLPKGQVLPTLSLARPANRRMAGALAGGVLGSIAANLASHAVNDAIIQPALYGREVDRAERWRRTLAAGVDPATLLDPAPATTAPPAGPS